MNVTELSSIMTQNKIARAYKEIKENTARVNLERKKCDQQKEENTKMYYILLAEMHQMQEIANPRLTPRTGGAVNDVVPAGTLPNLLELGTSHTSGGSTWIDIREQHKSMETPSDVNSARQLVQQTRQLARALAESMKQ